MLMLAVGIVFTAFVGTHSQAPEKPATTKQSVEWKTNLEKRSIEMTELMLGGPGKDGIPAIGSPKFVSVADASKWLQRNEPVISLTIKGNLGPIRFRY